LRLSPDGKLVALTVQSGNGTDIWIYDWQRDAMSKLTFVDGAFSYPVWSPDGRYLAFGANSEINWTRTDGAAKPQPLTQSKAVQRPSSFSPDGKRLAFVEFGSGTGDLWTVPVENEGGGLRAGKPEVFLQTAADESDPAFSPDGRWLAYCSDESGKDEVYVRAFPLRSSGQGGKWQISNNGGVFPHWSRTGQDLTYQSGDQIMAARYIVKGDTFMAEKPRIWIAKLGGAQWDLAPDGKRVAVLTPVEFAVAPNQEHEIAMLLNFFDELRRKVPIGK